MERRFKEASEENVKKYKDEHFDTSFRAQKEFYMKVEMDPEKIPSDEKIKAFVEKTMNPDLIKNHKTLVPSTNYDFYDYVKEIKAEPIEKKIVVLLDKDKRPIDSKVVETGTENRVWDPEGTLHETLRYLLSNPNARFFIVVHNHPNSIALFPSTGDLIQTAFAILVGNIIEIELLDSCIINEFDFYSMIQEKEEDLKEKLFFFEFDDEIKKKLRDQNFHMYYGMKRALEGDFLKKYEIRKWDE